MTKLDSILKSGDITLPTNVHLVKAMVFPGVIYGCESWTIKKVSKELMLLNCGVGEDSWEFLGLQDQTSQSSRKSFLNIHWKDWCWSWNWNPLASWCKGPTHLKRHWCRERLKAGGEWDDRGWDGWMPSPARLTCIWVNSVSCWWTGMPGMLQSMGSQRVAYDWVTELNWWCLMCVEKFSDILSDISFHIMILS